MYRPDADDPKAPVIMTHGPYGKGVRYQEHYKPMWEWLIGKHWPLAGIDSQLFDLGNRPILRFGSLGDMRLFALIREELGVRQDISTFFLPQGDARLLYHAIEWAGAPDLVERQSRAERHFLLRDQSMACRRAAAAAPGGNDSMGRRRRRIPATGTVTVAFSPTSSPRSGFLDGFVAAPSTEIPPLPKINLDGPKLSPGPKSCRKTRLADNYCDTLANARAREMDDEWYRGRGRRIGPKSSPRS